MPKSRGVKRTIFTASIDRGEPGSPYIVQQFFAFPASKDPTTQALDENAARTIFARRLKIDPETVTVSSAPEAKAPGYKFSYKRTSSEAASDYNTRRAVEYARWLAARDRIAVAVDIGPTVYHDFVRVPGQKALQRRARAVQFGSVTINIPNWDFVPSEPIEEILPETPVAPSCDLMAA